MSERIELRDVSGEEVRQVIGGISYSEAFSTATQAYWQQIEAKFDPSRLKYRIELVVPPRPAGH